MKNQYHSLHTTSRSSGNFLTLSMKLSGFSLMQFVRTPELIMTFFVVLANNVNSLTFWWKKTSGLFQTNMLADPDIF